MISAQVIKTSIEELQAITRVDLCVLDLSGSVVATTKEGENIDASLIINFANSPVDSQVIGNDHLLKILDEGDLAYILVASGDGESIYTVGKICVSQLQNLIVAYKSIENAYAHLEEIAPKRAKTNLEEHYDMAQMSKTLATIEVHAPIEFDMEAAKLTDLYTPEAYVYMKRLEFKNMLTRFSDDMSQNDLEKYFHVYHELDEIQNFFDGFSAK